MANPTRLFNLPVAIASILLRKWFDTYTGINSDIIDIATPNSLWALENAIRKLVQINGMTVCVFGAAASSIVYSLKKMKLFRIIPSRSRHSIACLTSCSIMKRPKLHLNSSLRMLFRRSSPLNRRNSRVGVSSNLFRPSPAAPVESPPILNQSPPAIAFHETFSIRSEAGVGRNLPRSTYSTASSTSNSHIDLNCLPTDPAKNQLALPMRNNRNLVLPQPRTPLKRPVKTHLQDIYGNIYDRRSIGISIDESGYVNQDLPRPIRTPQETPFNFRNLPAGDHCDGDYSLIADETDMDVFTPSVIREILPSVINLGTVDIRSTVGSPKANVPKTVKKKPIKRRNNKWARGKKRNNQKGKRKVVKKVQTIRSENNQRSRIGKKGLRQFTKKK